MPVWALDADRARRGARAAAGAERGERLGGGEYASDLPAGRLVVADDAGPVGVLFGALAPGRGVSRRTTRMTLLAVQVAGVPDIHVEEALWTVADTLGWGLTGGADESRAMDDPLALDPETMRATGYRMVDLLVERVAGLRDEPALTRASPAEMRARLHGPAPEGPTDFEAMLATLERDVLALGRVDHPAYFAFIPGSSTWPGALGDFLASALNIYAGSWMESSGPSQLELQVLDWFKEWIGYPADAAGILLSGGSAANMTALACARESLVGAMRDDLVLYVSDQAHSSLARAARTLGFRPDQMRVLPVDDAAPHAPRPARRRAWTPTSPPVGGRCSSSVSAGSTNTGAIDPLPELAEIARGAACGCTSTARTAASRR